MRRLLAALLLGVFVYVGAVEADNIAKEPITSTASDSDDSSQTTDERLEQKVTYVNARWRLHGVIDDLAKTSGVTIRAGKNSSDWRVRDIPIFVCAKDIPLGVLIRAIADSTHLCLSSSRATDTIAYRIWRDLKRENQLSKFEKSQKTAAIESVGYDWDLISHLRDVPKSDWEERSASDVDPESGRLWAATERSVSDVMAGLGDEAKNRLLSGDTLLLSCRTAPASVAPHIRSAFQAYWSGLERGAKRDGLPSPSPLDEDSLARCYIKISYVMQYGAPVNLRIQLIAGGGGGYRQIFPSYYEDHIRKWRPDIAPRPKPASPYLEADDLNKNYVKLVPSDKNGPDFLDTKVQVTATKNVPKPTYTGILREVSKACGYSIVAEGVVARLPYKTGNWEQELSALIERDITVREALTHIQKHFPSVDWYVDSDHKLILGRDKKWFERLRALVPEDLLIKMRDKLKTGIGLDDLEALVGLSSLQVDEWISYCPEFPGLEILRGPAHSVSEDMLWRLYFFLGKDKKALAKTGQAVTLAGLDSAWAAGFLRQRFLQKGEFAMRDGKLLPEQMLQQGEKLSDPNALGEVWLRLSDYELPESAKEMAGKHVYRIEVGFNSDEAIKLEDSLRGQYPLYAPAEKAEPKAANVPIASPSPSGGK